MLNNQTKVEIQKEPKNLGIWMDHATANLMDCTTEAVETTTIASAFTHDSKEETLAKSENGMHNKEQHQQGDYYKKLGAAIKNYDSVVLFGPTDAKAELHNLLKADHHFDKIKIEVKQTDKMTDHQKHAYVKEYFS
jgi:Zn-finger nucleic acid-binding protein